MKVRDRRDRIAGIVRQRKRVTVEELAAQLNISRETVRRDLSSLARAGRVNKVYGGATMPHVFAEGPFRQRLMENAAAKMRIAAKAASLFKPGETLFMNAGATTVYLAEKLARARGLTIITNSSQIAAAVRAPATGGGDAGRAAGAASAAGAENSAFLLGGEYDSPEKKTIGSMVISQIRAFRAHHAVLSIGALDARTGAMDFNLKAARISRAMAAQSESVTVLMDASKYDKLASFEVCPLTAITRLVVDRPPPAPLDESLKAAGVTIILAR